MSKENQALQSQNTSNGIYLVSPKIKDLPEFDPPLNLGVLASGRGSNFEAIIKKINSGDLNANVSLLIVNNPECEAIDRANRLNIPCMIINHREYSYREKLDEAIVKAFSEKNVEGIVMAGWMRIVTLHL